MITYAMFTFAYEAREDQRLFSVSGAHSSQCKSHASLMLLDAQLSFSWRSAQVRLPGHIV